MYDFATPVERNSPMTSTGPTKYDMRLNPIYQIDFQNCAAGKHISGTKRRVRFRFGFSNAEAIKEGLTGSDCRGEEHEVNLVWSLTSGKRLVLMDGDEVHFSMGNRTETLFETSWTMPGGHIVKIIAHAAPPLFVTPGFRQFDLLLDGCSIFEMPRIYELGKKNRSNGTNRRAQSSAALTPVVSTSPPPHYSTRSLPEQPHSTPMVETPRIESAPAMLDLLEAAPTANQDHLDSSMTMVTPTHDEFTPVEQAPTPPSFDLVSNQIMSNYATTPSASPVANQQPMLAITNEAYDTAAPVTPYQAPANNSLLSNYYGYQTMYSPPQWEQGAQATFYQPEQPAAPVTPMTTPVPALEESSTSTTTTTTTSPRLTMEQLSVAELEARDQPSELSEYDRTLRALVNFDDIMEMNETPEQSKSNKKKAVLQGAGKSKPLPPMTPDWHVGMNATLGDIRKHGHPKTASKKEIMRTHAFDPAAVQAGMMVVYGATTAAPTNTGYYYPQQPMQQQVISRAY